jgi:anti-anti-sigma factor
MHAPRADAPALQGLAIDALVQDGRILITVRGELDLGRAQVLQAALCQAIDSSVQGVDLDLSGTGFCDCANLNVLVTARRHAMDGHKTLLLRSASSAVQRLLTVTGTLSLFAPEDHEPTRLNLDEQASGEPALDHDEQALRSEVVQLRRAMQTRPVIDQARGVLMASFGLSPENAWNVLVSVSQNTNTKLHQLADEVVTAVQGGSLSEAVQRHMATAVAALRPTHLGSGGQ